MYDVIVQCIVQIIYILGYTEVIRCPYHLGFFVESLDKLKSTVQSCFYYGAKHITLYVRTKSEIRYIRKLLRHQYNKDLYKVTIIHLPFAPNVFNLHSHFHLHEINRAFTYY